MRIGLADTTTALPRTLRQNTRGEGDANKAVIPLRWIDFNGGRANSSAVPSAASLPLDHDCTAASRAPTQLHERTTPNRPALGKGVGFAGGRGLI